jgi:putative ABC transport system substrate-binding protein
MGKRFFGITLSPLLLALCFAAHAQQVQKTYRIGYLSAGRGIEVREEVFRQALRELGYTEGKNLVIEWRFAKSRQSRAELAAELVRLKVDCIVATGSGETAIAQKATSTIPIVMMSSSDPVGTKFVASLARPGGNITGLTSISGDLGGKGLELLKEIVPGLSRVIGAEPAGGSGSQDLFFKETEEPARALGIKLIRVPYRGPEDYEEIFQTATRERAEALLSRLPPTTPLAQRKRFVGLAAKNRLPAIYFEGTWADAGGLMSYGPDRLAMDRRAADYVDKILKGAKPADIPVERPTKFEFVINLKAAKQIGLTIPQSVLFRATKVIK